MGGLNVHHLTLYLSGLKKPRSAESMPPPGPPVDKICIISTLNVLDPHHGGKRLEATGRGRHKSRIFGCFILCRTWYALLVARYLVAEIRFTVRFFEPLISKERVLEVVDVGHLKPTSEIWLDWRIHSSR